MKRFIVATFFVMTINAGLSGLGYAQQAVNPVVANPNQNLELPIVNNRQSVSTPGVQAERSVAATSSDIGYWLSQKQKLEAEDARLQAQLTDLRKQIDESPQKELIEKIRACQEFEAEIFRLQSGSGKFIESALVQTLAWIQRSAAEHERAWKEDLEARRGTDGRDSVALIRQVDETQKAIALNAQLKGVLSSTIANLRSDRERQNKIQELNSVIATPANK